MFKLFNNAPQGVAFFRSIELRDASCVFNSKKNTFCVNGFDLHMKIVADSVTDRRFYKVASKEAGSKLWKLWMQTKEVAYTSA